MPPQQQQLSQAVDLQPYIQRTKKLRNAFVLRKFHHVGYHAHAIIQDFIHEHKKLPAIASIESYPYQHTFNADELISSGIIPMHLLFPWKPDFVDNNTQQLNKGFEHRKFIPKTFPLTEDHPVMMCINYVLIAIQNVGYLPTQPTAENESSWSPTHAISEKISEPITPTKQSGFIAHQIAQFLCNIFGTWVNVQPTIVLSLLDQFLTLSPLLAVFISATLLSQLEDISQKEDLSNSTTAYLQDYKARYCVRNIDYRRQLYVYFIQAFAIALRLRLHHCYLAQPIQTQVESLVEYAEILKQVQQEDGVSSDVEQTQKDPFNINSQFVQIFFDTSPGQVSIMRQEIKNFAVFEEDQVEYTKDAEMPYIPSHVQEQVDAVLNIIDISEDPHQFSPVLLRVFLSGVTTILPKQCNAQFSSYMLVKKPQTKKQLQAAADKEAADRALDKQRLIKKFTSRLQLSDESRAMYEEFLTGEDDAEKIYRHLVGEEYDDLSDMSEQDFHDEDDSQDEEDVGKEATPHKKEAIPTGSTPDNAYEINFGAAPQQEQQEQPTLEQDSKSPIVTTLEEQANKTAQPPQSSSSYLTLLAGLGISAAALSSAFLFFRDRK